MSYKYFEYSMLIFPLSLIIFIEELLYHAFQMNFSLAWLLCAVFIMYSFLNLKQITTCLLGQHFSAVVLPTVGSC